MVKASRKKGVEGVVELDRMIRKAFTENVTLEREFLKV